MGYFFRSYPELNDEYIDLSNQECRKVSIPREESPKYPHLTWPSTEDYAIVKIWYTAGRIDVESTYSGQYLHEQWPDLYGRDGRPINTKYEKKLKEKEEKEKAEKERKKAEKEAKDGKEVCLTKLWKAPFRLLWWAVKKVFWMILSIITLGLINKFFGNDE